MRQWWTLLLFIVVLIPLLAAPGTGKKHCATVYALGYDGTRGIKIPITACAGPGNGSVFVSADGTLSESFQEAVHQAFSVLSSRYAIGNKDIYITISGPAALFEGESAGAAIYAAMFAAITGLNPKNLAASGVIRRDGTVGQVLYARQKANAFEGKVILPVGSCVQGANCVQTVGDIEKIVQSQSV